jgi:hypothetical protein
MLGVMCLSPDNLQCYRLLKHVAWQVISVFTVNSIGID